MPAGARAQLRQYRSAFTHPRNLQQPRIQESGDSQNQGGSQGDNAQEQQ